MLHTDQVPPALAVQGGSDHKENGLLNNGGLGSSSTASSMPTGSSERRPSRWPTGASSASMCTTSKGAATRHGTLRSETRGQWGSLFLWAKGSLSSAASSSPHPTGRSFGGTRAWSRLAGGPRAPSMVRCDLFFFSFLLLFFPYFIPRFSRGRFSGTSDNRCPDPLTLLYVRHKPARGHTLAHTLSASGVWGWYSLSVHATTINTCQLKLLHTSQPVLALAVRLAWLAHPRSAGRARLRGQPQFIVSCTILPSNKGNHSGSPVLNTFILRISKNKQ